MSTAIDISTADACIGDGSTSLLDSVNSEDTATRYDIGHHSKRIDVLEHVKIGLRLGIRERARDVHRRRTGPSDQ